MARGPVNPDTHQHFMMEDMANNRRVPLVEVIYLLEMFDLERVSEKGKPVAITLREKQSHFEARQKANESLSRSLVEDLEGNK